MNISISFVGGLRHQKKREKRSADACQKRTHQQNRRGPKAVAEIEAPVPSQGARRLESQRRPRHVHVAVAEQRRVQEFRSGERAGTAGNQGRETLHKLKKKKRASFLPTKSALPRRGLRRREAAE